MRIFLRKKVFFSIFKLKIFPFCCSSFSPSPFKWICQDYTIISWLFLLINIIIKSHHSTFYCLHSLYYSGESYKNFVANCVRFLISADFFSRGGQKQNICNKKNTEKGYYFSQNVAKYTNLGRSGAGGSWEGGQGPLCPPLRILMIVFLLAWL